MASKEDMIAWINNASYTQLLSKWRFEMRFLVDEQGEPK